tara:strand:+ start:44 stop:790 length:747 start_codon:yes stop_codon:yes gene_type:complete
MNQITFCKVEGCRFPHKHTTLGHKCGIKGCKQFGHGQLEHYCQHKLNLLKQFYNQTLPEDLKCTILNCPFPQHHTTDSHQCRKCKRFGHGVDDCILSDLNSISDVLLNGISKQKIYDFMNDTESNFYIEIHSQFDSSLFIKNNNTNSYCRTCFISNHNNDIDTNIILNQFLSGLTNKSTEFNNYLNTTNITNITNSTKECPLCRTHSLVKEIDIFIESECKICMVKDVELVFIECKHACICKECFEKI